LGGVKNVLGGWTPPCGRGR